MVPFESLCVNGFLFAFHSNYGRTFCRFDTIHERDGHSDTQPDTSRQQQPRYTASLGCSRAAKIWRMGNIWGRVHNCTLGRA